MTELALAPVQWGHFNDIDETKPFGEDDTSCLSDIRDVLKKHGKQNRLGVALLHHHLSIGDDEVFLEQELDQQRAMLLQPVKASDLDTQRNTATILHLRDGEILAAGWCRSYCHQGWLGHSDAHNVEN
ncbi:MAG: hypothetical protein WBF53_08110 [Litorimonas sp.]